MVPLIPVSMNKITKEKKTLGKIVLQNTQSGAGEQILPLGCRAKARNECRFIDTGITCSVARFYPFGQLCEIEMFPSEPVETATDSPES